MVGLDNRLVYCAYLVLPSLECESCIAGPINAVNIIVKTILYKKVVGYSSKS